MNEKIGRLYEYYYQKISDNSNFKFTPTEREEKSISNFVTYINYYYVTHIGNNFLFDYLAFQFSYWSNKKTREPDGLPKIEWVIGPKALKRWHKRNKTYYRYFANKDVLNPNKITLQEFLKKQNNFKILGDDRERKRLHNTKRGWINCLNKTQLYQEESKYCKICIFKEKCIMIKNRILAK